MTHFPFLPGEERYLVIDDTDENASQVLLVALDGMRLATWRRREDPEPGE